MRMAAAPHSPAACPGKSVELQPVPPLVYLVPPALRFHPSTGELLKFLSPELEVVRVGLAESWRGGLRVVLRQ